jgi:hypothetical protein
MYQVLIEDGHCGLTIVKVHMDGFKTYNQACVEANLMNSHSPEHRAVATAGFGNGSTHTIRGKSWIVRQISQNLIILMLATPTGDWEKDNLFVTRPTDDD